MTENDKGTFIFAAAVMMTALVSWLGVLGLRHRAAKIAVYTIIWVMGVALLFFGSLIELVPIIQPHLALPNHFVEIGYYVLAMGLMVIPVVVAPIRRFLQNIFPGLDAANPSHAWLLYAFGLFLVLMLSIITLFYNPITIIASLKQVSLVSMTLVTVTIFLLFSLLASGWGAGVSFSQVVLRLGLGKLPWKTVGILIGLGLVLMISIQILESGILRLESPATRSTLLQIGQAMRHTQSVGLLAILGIMGASLFAGVGEEILCRGFLQPLFGIVPTAVFFTLLHTHYGPTLILSEILIIGLILGWVRKRYNTTAAIILHASFDFFSLAIGMLFHFHAG